MSTFLKCLLFFFIITSTLFFAQDKSSAKEKSKISTEDKTNAPQTMGETITFNNSENNPIITITDEGNNAGSIILPPVGIMTSALNKLYNVGGTLYFNGSALGTGGGVTSINDLSDAKYDGSSLFLGYGSGLNDDATSNANTAVGRNSLYKNTSGYYNTAIGRGTLAYNTEGFSNTAVGHSALANNTLGKNNSALGDEALYSNTAADGNTAIGYQSLYSFQCGPYAEPTGNTAIGYQSLYSNKIGGGNTAVGNKSLYSNTADGNTAIGGGALQSNTTGQYNTAVGGNALLSNITGINNTAVGSWALLTNNGESNSAFGSSALGHNETANDNTGVGAGVLVANRTGDANTAVGSHVLYWNEAEKNTAMGCEAQFNNTTGVNNTAMGYQALYANTTGAYNTAIGYTALNLNKTGSFNTAVGYNAGPNSDFSVNSMALGYNATTTANYQVRIGNSAVTSIGGYQDWTKISDIRYKQNIREDVRGLDFILGLRPITYNLNVSAIAEKLGEDMMVNKNGNRIKKQPSTEILASRSAKANERQSGFAAQEVEALANKLGYDFGGVDKPANEDSFYGLRYAEFVVPLVKAVQEQQEIIEKLTKRIEDLENGNLGQRAGMAQ